MSRKPTIKISYPEASEKALQLTEAMVKRAPGKRIVETESEDPIFPDGGELFSGFIRCKTQTGVELTLTLNSSSMDYALETLIRPNLTADERKRILGEDPEQTELALTPGEQKKKIEIGKMEAVELRRIISDLQDDMNHHRGDQIEIAHRAFDAICEAAHMTAHDFAIEMDDKSEETEEDIILVDRLAVLICGAQRVTSKNTTPVKLFASDLIHYIQESFDDAAEYVVTVRELTRALSDVQSDFKENPKRWLEEELKILAEARLKKDPSWDDVEREARQMQAPCTKAVRGSARGTASGDDEAATPSEAADEDIEPGLLNDLDDGSDGMSPAEEVIGHDE